MLATRFSMADHFPTSFSFIVACLLSLLAYFLPAPTTGGDLQIYLEALTLLAKAVAPAGTLATALFAYYRWRTERRDKQMDKRRITKLETEAREFEAERARFRDEIRRLVEMIDARETDHHDRKLRRLNGVESELAQLKNQVRALRDK